MAFGADNQASIAALRRVSDALYHGFKLAFSSLYCLLNSSFFNFLDTSELVLPAWLSRLVEVLRITLPPRLYHWCGDDSTGSEIMQE